MTLQNNLKMPSSPSKRWWNRIMWFAVIALVSTQLHAQPMSGTYTVCAKNCQFSSVTDAVDALNNNGVNGPVVISISAGTYTEKNIQVGTWSGGVSGVSSKNTITFKGAGSTKTTITESVSSYGEWIFMVAYTDYVTITDLDIYNSVSFTNYNDVYGLYLYYSNNCKVENSLIRFRDGDSWDDYGQYGIYSQYCTNTLYANNWIRGGYYGLYQYGSGNSYYGDTIRNNRFTRSFYYAINRQYRYDDVIKNNFIDTCLYGIYSYQDNASTIEGNIINGNGAMNYSTYMDVAMQLGYPAESYTTKPLTIRNNIFRNFNYNGIDAYSYNYYPYANLDIYHNTFIQCPNAQSYSYCIYYYNGGYSYGYDIRNNIFYCTGGGGFSVYSVDVSAGDMIDGNNYNIGNGPFAEVSYSQYFNLDDLRSNFGIEENGTTTQVSFKSTTDAHLDPNYPAPYAPNVGVNTDIDGDSRCALFPTVGADENNVGKGPFKAKFFAPGVIYDSSPTTIYNAAKESEPKKHSWYVDGVFVTNETNLSTTFTGTSHVISLATTGCGGYDSTSQTITITTPAKAPTSDFVANKNQILQGNTVVFTDLSDLGPNGWDWDISPKTTNVNGSPVNRFRFIKGTSKTSQNPTVQFDYPGKYEICLTAKNVKGSANKECKTDYVDVFPVMNMGQESETRSTQGFLYDDGGPTNGISQSGKTKLLINACAEEVYLVINKFDMYCGDNYLRIYDGEVEDDSYALHPCTSNISWTSATGFTGGPSGWGSGCPYECKPAATDTFVAKSGKMLIVQDVNNNWPAGSPGFEAQWWSTPKNFDPPVASFESDSVVCQNGVLEFKNTSTGEGNKYYWDLDGDIETFETNDADETLWLFPITGKRSVTLIAENCGGMDTFTKEITVFVPTKPTISFEADNLNPTTSDVVFFSSTVPECVDDFEWTISKSNGTQAVYVNSSKTSENPRVTLPDTGCWNVTLKATNVSGASTLTKTCYIKVKESYCIPSAAQLISDIGIAEVAIMASADSSDIMRNSSAQAARDYTNYVNEKALGTTLEIGVTYILNVKRNTNANKMTTTAWIDWNLDGDFNDPQEKIASLDNSSDKDWKYSFTIPIIAKTGASVLRIGTNLGNYANEVCGQNKFGEFEDYRIHISDDKTPPVITLYRADGSVYKAGDTLVIEQGRKYTEYGFKAVDNLDGDVTGQIKTDTIIMPNTPVSALNTFVVRVYGIRYNARDASGNDAKTAVRIVKILKDTTAPALVIAQPDVLLWDVDKAATFAMPKIISINDIVDGIQVTIDTMVYNDGVLVPMVDPYVVDTYEVVYTATDAAGNTTTVNRRVIIQDVVAPTLTLNGTANVQHPVGTPYTDAGVVIGDNYYDPLMLESLLQVTSNVDENKIGVYEVCYSITDPSGNGPVRACRSVEVKDLVAPTVTFKGNDTIYVDVNTLFRDPDFTVYDNYYAEHEITVDRSGTLVPTLKNEMPGVVDTFKVTYTFTDGSANASSETFTVIVQDRVAPMVELKGTGTAMVCRWGAYTDLGYTIKDNYYTAASDFTVEQEGTLPATNPTDLEGLFDLRYKVTDKSGNVGYSPYRSILVQSPEHLNCMTGIEKTAAIDKLVSVYPNPTTGLFTVKVAFETQQQLRISVLNLLGEEVSVVNNGQVLSDVYSVDLSTQASGIYMLKFQGADYSFTKRVVLNK